MELSTQFSKISLQLSGHVARLRLNHPLLNVIDIPMMEELAQAISQVEAWQC
jgi:enoyl-CoA hydratase/carnithine racemase